MSYNENKTRTWKDGTTPATGTLALGSLFNAEFNRLYNNFKNFFNALGTIFSIDTINEQTLNNGVTIETANIKDGDITLPSGKALKGTGEGAGIEETNGEILRFKIIDIGDWNMDTTLAVGVSHGLTASKIRTLQVVIRGDVGSIFDDSHIPLDFSDLTNVPDGSFRVGPNPDEAVIALNRRAGGIFDSSLFNATSYNRGWITIGYID